MPVSHWVGSTDCGVCLVPSCADAARGGATEGKRLCRRHVWRRGGGYARVYYAPCQACERRTTRAMPGSQGVIHHADQIVLLRRLF